MKAWVLWIAVCGLGAAAEASRTPAPGLYVPDLSGIRKTERPQAKLVYGEGVFLKADGTSFWSTMATDGVWTMNRGRVVVNHSSVLMRKRPLPEDVLRGQWPTQPIAGFVWRPGPGGAWLQQGPPTLPGTIVWRRLELPFSEVVRREAAADEADMGASVLWELEKSRQIEARPEEVERFLLNPKTTRDDRISVLFSLARSGPAGERAVARLWKRSPNGTAILPNPQSWLRYLPTPELLGVLPSYDNDPPALRRAILRLRELKDPEALPALRTLAQHRDRGVRESAVSALAEFQDPASAQLFREALSARRESRGYGLSDIMAALVSVTPDAAEKESLLDGAALLASEGDGSFQIDGPSPMEGLRVLEAGGRDGVPRLIAVLETAASSRIRAEAAMALGQLGDRRAIPALLAVRDAMTARANEDRPRPLPSEFVALSQDDAYLAYAVREALWQIQHAP